MNARISAFSRFCMIVSGVSAITGCFQFEPTGSGNGSNAEQPAYTPESQEVSAPTHASGGNGYLVNPNRRMIPASEVNSAAKTAAGPLVGTYRDWSGQVQINVYECSASGDPNVRIMCEVAADEVLVGGGARITGWSGSGALLQESRPVDAGLLTWAASSKSHLSGSNHNLYVYAYGMKVSGVSRSDLYSRMMVKTETSASSSHPKAVATLPNGYVTIGGGAQVLENPVGNYLTLSAPHDEGSSAFSTNSWYAKSKDHKQSSPAKIVAWVIGIKWDGFYEPHPIGKILYAPIPNWGTLEIFHKNTGTGATVGSGIASDFISPTPEYIVSCPGGYATWTNGSGRMLISMFPYFSGVYAQSKDHLTASGGTVIASMIQIKKMH